MKWQRKKNEYSIHLLDHLNQISKFLFIEISSDLDTIEIKEKDNFFKTNILEDMWSYLTSRLDKHKRVFFTSIDRFYFAMNNNKKMRERESK